MHDYTLYFTGSPCYNVSYYNYISMWLYYIVIRLSAELFHLGRKDSINFKIQLFCKNYHESWSISPANNCDNIYLSSGEMYHRQKSKNITFMNQYFLAFLEVVITSLSEITVSTTTKNLVLM